MALDTARQVRLRIQDIPQPADRVLYGDGTAVRFPLEHRNLTSGTAYVGIGSPPTAWSATGGVTFNVSGFVQFTNIISANTAFRVEYVHSVFSDEEIGHFTAVGGSVAGAALEACRALMFDGLKRARWMSPDGTQYDDTQANQALRNLESALKYEVEQEVFGYGAVHSWTVEQENT